MVGNPDDIFSLPTFAVTPAAAKRVLIGMAFIFSASARAPRQPVRED